MKTIINNLEKQIITLEKQQTKEYSNYRKNNCSESYDKVHTIISAISKLEDIISKLKNSYDEAL